MKNYKIKDKRPFYMMFIILILIIIGSNHLIVVNVTESEPQGIYIRDFSPLKRGDYVIIPKKYIEEYSPYMGFGFGDTILKNVVGLSGDIYSVYNHSLNIKDISVNIKERTHSGLVLPQIPEGKHSIGKNHFLGISNYHENSFDCRYMGELPTYYIVAKVRPLILF